MRMRLFLMSCLAFTLAACGTLPSVSMMPAPPGAVAAQTTLDERALLGVELSYKAANSLATEAAHAGFVDAGLAVKIAALDNRLFATLKRARVAYASANAASYGAAIAEASPLVSEIWALVAGTGRADRGR